MFFSSKVDCVPFKLGENQLYILCILVSFGSGYLLLGQIWHASPVTKLFVWPMTVLLCVHWLFDLTVHSMHSQQMGQVCILHFAVRNIIGEEMANTNFYLFWS